MAEESARYERRDFNPRIIAFFAVGLVVFCILVAIGMRLMEKRLNRFFAYPGTATWTSSPTTVVPLPRLQIDPARELAEMRAQEEATLQSYGWVDRRNGVIRLPIGVAMKLTAERGLPVRKGAPATTSKTAP